MGDAQLDPVPWVEQHLAGVFDGPVHQSDIRGGQSAADRALAAVDLAGYARDRNTVLPVASRGATGLSPYVRHGLLHLSQLWDVTGPSEDVRAFRDELLWQEYARHLYARLGRATRRSLRYAVPDFGPPDTAPWPGDAACIDFVLDELATRGWLTNQTRMWIASQWGVRAGLAWATGEDWLFRHLLDGSRAANRLGWQWTVGALTGKPYVFRRWQVENRAPELCGRCALETRCPIEQAPPIDAPEPLPVPDPRLRAADPASDSVLQAPIVDGKPEMVWLTAESLGDDDPALRAHPDVPAIFVFDLPLLQRLRLSAARLVFLAECLADLAERRTVIVDIGDPVEVLRDIPVAATVAPVPGWADRAQKLSVVARYPWPWLVTPHGGPVSSFSAWRKSVRR